MFSIAFPTLEAREAATEIYYLQELDRQAEIAAAGIYRAVMKGRVTRDPRDPVVWGALQNSLFAVICAARLLKPVRIKDAYPGMDRTQSQKFADDRGEMLRMALGIEADSHILDVQAVRNAYEHYDEYFDQYLAGGAECFTDWYITDLNRLATPPKQAGQPATAVGIRVFFPAGGILYFEDRELHLFELEVELIELRAKITERVAKLQEKIKGRAMFGNHNFGPAVDPRRADQRFQDWQHKRAEALERLASSKP